MAGTTTKITSVTFSKSRSAIRSLLSSPLRWKHVCDATVPLLIIPVYWGGNAVILFPILTQAPSVAKYHALRLSETCSAYLCRCRRTHTATPLLPGVARHWHRQRHTACHESFEPFFAACCLVLFIRSRLPSTANEDFAYLPTFLLFDTARPPTLSRLSILRLLVFLPVLCFLLDCFKFDERCLYAIVYNKPRPPNSLPVGLL